MAPCLLSLLMVLAADEPQAAPKSLEEALRAMNLEEARHWRMYLDEDRKTEAKLIERPVYLWTNPTKGRGQFGSVFVWVYDGRPAVIGSFFAHPFAEGKRRLTHELHQLAAEPIAPQCTDDDPNVWVPKTGVRLQPLADAPAPDASPAKRLLQIRSLGRQFGGHTVDWRKQRWELRLLPQPLYRYEKPKDKEGELIDGALLALVTDAGTDPEVLILVEARQDGWHYALLRFSDSSLYVERQGKEVWSSVRSPENPSAFNPDHTYRVFQKRVIDDPIAQ